jgi:hypothetical protein
MSVFSKLFPPANREAAGVAFIRTAWQTARATAVLSVGGGVIVTAAQLAAINWLTVLYTVGGIVITSLIAGGLAGGDILVHGLPGAYAPPVEPEAAPVEAPAAPVEPAA